MSILPLRNCSLSWKSTYLLIRLCQVLVAACMILSCSMQTLSCSLWDLVPWPGMEPGPPVLRVWSLLHWTTRLVPKELHSWEENTRVQKQCQTKLEQWDPTSVLSRTAAAMSCVWLLGTWDAVQTEKCPMCKIHIWLQKISIKRKKGYKMPR